MITSHTFDVAEAFWCFYAEWHSGGLTDRCRSKGRSISGQLHRMKFDPRSDLSSETLEGDGRDIYDALVMAYHPNEHRCRRDDKYLDRDARGIPTGYVCHICIEAKRASYRSDIFIDPSYWHDEPIG